MDAREKEKNTTRFLLTFFLGWIGSLIINHSDFKPKGYKSRTLAYIFLTYITFGIYGLVASISNLSFDPDMGKTIGYVRDYTDQYVLKNTDESSMSTSTSASNSTLVSGSQFNYDFGTLTLKNQFKALISIILAFVNLITILFPWWLTPSCYGVDTLLSWENEDITVWIGLFAWLSFIAAIILLIVAIRNVKYFICDEKLIMIASIVCTIVYMLLQTFYVSGILTYHNFIEILHNVYPKGLCIEIVLLFMYAFVSKMNISMKSKQATVAAQAVDSKVVVPTMDDIELVRKLSELKELGVISQEEFDEKKKQILGM